MLGSSQSRADGVLLDGRRVTGQYEPVSDAEHGDEAGYQGWFQPHPSVDPPGWVDGAPTSGHDQSCALCGSAEVALVHPLEASLVTHRQYGKGHRLPTFWALCQSCEDLYQDRADVQIVEIMKSSAGWFWDFDDDVSERIQKQIAVFRRADKGARLLDD
ncbi:MAG: hypothetical protein QOK46_1818 [Microbacteriaceae bacterium]|nr:hypothetical protein [Microbacteriaceae bacterium]